MRGKAQEKKGEFPLRCVGKGTRIDAEKGQSRMVESEELTLFPCGRAKRAHRESGNRGRASHVPTRHPQSGNAQNSHIAAPVEPKMGFPKGVTPLWPPEAILFALAAGGTFDS